MNRLARISIATALTSALVMGVPAASQADEGYPPIPATVYECAQAESYANAFNTSHAWAGAWQERALLAEAKLAAKRSKIQRMKSTINRMQARIQRMEVRLQIVGR